MIRMINDLEVVIALQKSLVPCHQFKVVRSPSVSLLAPRAT